MLTEQEIKQIISKGEGSALSLKKPKMEFLLPYTIPFAPF